MTNNTQKKFKLDFKNFSVDVIETRDNILYRAVMTYKNGKFVTTIGKKLIDDKKDK